MGTEVLLPLCLCTARWQTGIKGTELECLGVHADGLGTHHHQPWPAATRCEPQLTFATSPGRSFFAVARSSLPFQSAVRRVRGSHGGVLGARPRPAPHHGSRGHAPAQHPGRRWAALAVAWCGWSLCLCCGCEQVGRFAGARNMSVWLCTWKPSAHSATALCLQRLAVR